MIIETIDAFPWNCTRRVFVLGNLWPIRDLRYCSMTFKQPRLDYSARLVQHVIGVL